LWFFPSYDFAILIISVNCIYKSETMADQQQVNKEIDNDDDIYARLVHEFMIIC
jgi:hypothetical protein